MNNYNRNLLLTALLAVIAQAGNAAPMRYQGQLTDAGKPANGSYDVQISLFDAAAGGATLDFPVAFDNVQVVNGQFELELNAPEAARNRPAWLQAAVRDGASNGVFVPVNGREKVTLEPQISACWSTTGDTGSNPAVNYLGNSDNQTLVLNSPSGVSVNKRSQIISQSVDLLVAAKVFGDDDADIGMETSNGKTASIFTRDNNGNLVLSSQSGAMEFNDGVSNQNNGAPLYTFSGRLRLESAGNSGTDVSGGIWLDDEVASASYLGRGTNGQNWTGVSTANVWRFTVADDGLAVINGTTDPIGGADLVINARPLTGDADTDLVMQTRTGKKGRLYLSDVNGGLNLSAFNLNAGTNFLSTGNGASLSNGGVWTNASSRELKEGFAAVDIGALLDKVISLPITTWTYKTSSEGTHMGPIAEDFKAVFGLAGDGKAIATVDADGVALAAIQGLNAKLETENATLRERLARIEAVLGSMQPAQ